MKIFAWSEPSWSATIFGWTLIAVCVIGGFFILLTDARAVTPDPPPGTTKPVSEAKFVCAFNMVKIMEDDGHVYWQVGKKRWCKWVAQ